MCIYFQLTVIVQFKINKISLKDQYDDIAKVF
jgi:hypothetical protein